MWPKGKQSALLHFKAVLSFLSLFCFRYFLKVQEEDWSFNCFPFTHQLSQVISHIQCSWGWMPDTLTYLSLQTGIYLGLRSQTASREGEKVLFFPLKGLNIPLFGSRQALAQISVLCDPGQLP